MTVCPVSLFLLSLAYPELELTHLHVELGPVVPGSQSISEDAQMAFLQLYYSGVQKVHHFLARNPSAGSRLLKPAATRFYEHALLDGRRITPTTRTRRKTAGSCLVKVIWQGKDVRGYCREHIPSRSAWHT